MRIDYSAKVACSQERCTECAEYREGAEETNLETFGKNAERHFRRLGWRFRMDASLKERWVGNLCPMHDAKDRFGEVLVQFVGRQVFKPLVEETPEQVAFDAMFS